MLGFTAEFFYLWFVINNGMAFAEQRFMIFVGAASKPPTEEAARSFEKKTGIKIDLVFGGSGYVLSQMIFSKQGDIYFPGSSDYMELAKNKEAVFPETEAIVVYLVNATNVQKGNLKNIQSLKDLTRAGLKVAIANPEGMCVGAYAVEIIERNFTPGEKLLFRRNLVNYAESCEKTATAISLRMADAVIGWRIFQYWDPERIEAIALNKSEIIRVGYIPVAISRFTKNKELSQKFVDFLMSNEGKEIYKKYNYFMTPDEAFIYIKDTDLLL